MALELVKWGKAGRILRSTTQKRLECLEQTISRNMDSKDVAGEGSEGSNEHIIRNWRKQNRGYVVAESLEEFCPAVPWKILLSNELHM